MKIRKEVINSLKNPTSPMTVGATVFSRISEAFKPTIHTPLNQFFKDGWKIIEPMTPLIWDWSGDCISEYLMAVHMGQIQNLIISMPFRMAKSNLVTVMFPAWAWTEKPWLRLVNCSYSAGLSVKHATDRRTLIRSEWYQSNWGHQVQLKDDQDVKSAYENTRRGHMIATSVGGTITGKGGHGIIMDDMINPLEAESYAKRTHAVNMYQQVLSNRIDDPKTGFKILVAQRTHAQDLTGHILANEIGWEHLKIPLVAEKKTIIEMPISKTPHVREVGDTLQPERFTPAAIKKLQGSMGSRAWSAQAQQEPTSEKGNILKRDWWRFWTNISANLDRPGYVPKPTGYDVAIQSWDLNFEKTDDGSFVVGQVWWRRGVQKFLMDQHREREGFVDTLEAVRYLTKSHPECGAKLVENKANGAATINVLQDEIGGMIPVDPMGAKAVRAQAAAPSIQAGNVYLPDPQMPGFEWVNEYIDECANFKGVTGEVNDQVDATSQALIRLNSLDYETEETDNSGQTFGGIDHSELESVGGFS